jgi:8-oxo-dGTP diphosphatase
MKSIAVIAGIVRNEAQQILVAFRPAHLPQGNLWEFPGGKIEPGELPMQALVREFKEEVGIHISSAQAWLSSRHCYADKIILLQVWQVLHYSGQPQGLEGQVIRWVTAQQLQDLTFPAANLPILQALQNTNFECKF